MFVLFLFGNYGYKFKVVDLGFFAENMLYNSSNFLGCEILDRMLYLILFIIQCVPRKGCGTAVVI